MNVNASPIFLFLPPKFHQLEIPIPLTSRMQLHEEHMDAFISLARSEFLCLKLPLSTGRVKSREYLFIDPDKNEAFLNKEAEEALGL